MNSAHVPYHMRTGIFFALLKLHLILSGVNPFLSYLPTISTDSLMYSHCQNLHVCKEASLRDIPASLHKRNKINPEKFTLADCSYGGTAEKLGLVLA